MRTARAQRGFSIVELMVAAVVSLAASFAIFQTFAISEGQRRATVAGGDATFSGLMGLSLMQRDLRMAGYGMNIGAPLGCQARLYDVLSAPNRTIDFTFAPFVITQGAAGAPDQITVAYGNSEVLPLPTTLLADAPDPLADMSVKNPFGIFAGDLLLVAQPGKRCLMIEATNTPTTNTAVATTTLEHKSGMYTIGSASRAARYNPPSGTALSATPAEFQYNRDAFVFNLGRAPTVVRYYVAGNTLTSDELVSGGANVAMASNIVQLQAQYGRDTSIPADGIVDVWTDATPTTAAEWASTLAIRAALVARAQQPERPNPTTGTCDATPASPTWGGGAIDLSADPQWQCYRYRVFEITISLRNQIWRPA